MLSDEVASKVLGELHAMTKQIDEQGKQLAAAIATAKQAADQIKANSVDAVKHARDAALHAQSESYARFELKLTDLIAKSMDQVTVAVATNTVMRWIVAGVMIAAALTLIVGIVSHWSGKEAGKAEGYAEAMDEKAAVAWANTPEGQLAYSLAQGGDIRRLASCSGEGWVVEGDTCFAKPVTAGGGKQVVYGWKIKR